MIAKVRLPLPDTSSDVKDEVFFNKADKNEFKLETEIKINHHGEVNKARAMPQTDKYNFIACKTVSGEVHIFDFHKHPSRPTDTIVKPDLRLQGHSKEGFGLSWNPNKIGYILSGSDDYKVIIILNRLVCGIFKQKVQQVLSNLLEPSKNIRVS